VGFMGLKVLSLANQLIQLSIAGLLMGTAFDLITFMGSLRAWKAVSVAHCIRRSD